MLACVAPLISPSSSRNSVPRSPCSKRPRYADVAPVNAPRSCPNNSDSCNDTGIAAQLTGTKGPECRCDASWIARATSSVPVPVSPRMQTVTGLVVNRDLPPRAPRKLRRQIRAALHNFEDLDAVESALKKLIDREMAVFIPKQTGWREPRYMHLFAGPVDVAALADAPTAKTVAPSNDRVAHLEIQLETLRAELDSLRQEFNAFRTQF